LVEACRLVFFGGTAGSGATIAVLSDTPAGASPTFGGSAGDAGAAADAVAGPGAVPEAGAIAGASATPALASAVAATGEGVFAVVAAVADAVVAGNVAFGDDAFAGAALAVGALAVGALAADVIAGAGAAVFTAAARGWLCDVARADVRAGLFGLSFATEAAPEPGEDSLADVTAGATCAAGATGAAGTPAGATAATDGTVAVRTLVTIARAAVGVLPGSPERSIKDSTTPAPAVAPIAVATRTTRAVRAKLGAGAK
jgi:hypothetical protein